MADEFNSWETSSGLIDEYTGEVVDAHFGYKEEYRNGEALLLFLEIQTGDPELGEAGVITEQYPVGNGWETGDKGKTTTHESGRAKKFNGNSGIGLLIDSIRDAGGIAALSKKGESNEAASYIGLNATFTRKEFSMKNPDGGDDVKWARMLVSEVHQGNGKTVAKKAESAQDTSSDDSETPSATEHKIPAALKIKLKKLAGEAADHDAFVEAAYEIDGVDGNQAVEDAVGDEAFYTSLKG